MALCFCSAYIAIPATAHLASAWDRRLRSIIFFWLCFLRTTKKLEHGRQSKSKKQVIRKQSVQAPSHPDDLDEQFFFNHLFFFFFSFSLTHILLCTALSHSILSYDNYYKFSCHGLSGSHESLSRRPPTPTPTHTLFSLVRFFPRHDNLVAHRRQTEDRVAK